VENSVLLPVSILVALTVIGVVSLRRFSEPVRFSFDAVCLAALTYYFHDHGLSPVFPPLDGGASFGALALRVAGGAWWLLAARLVVAALLFAFHRDRGSRKARLFSDLLAAAIYLATCVIILNSVFSLPVTGVMATSGVVAIVIGLALQNTLADVFAGIAVGVEAPFHVGDRVQIGDRIEGVVVQINWRSVRIQTDGDDVAIIPNSQIAKAEIINRSSPSQQRNASVEIPVSTGAQPERVIEILLQAAMLCPDILATPAPAASLTQLGMRHNIFKISFSVATTRQLSPTKDLLLRSARRLLHYARLGARVHRPDRIGLLRDIMLFDGLEDLQIEALAGQLATKRLEPGDILFSEQESDGLLHVVASGVIEISRRHGDNVQALGCIGAGNYVGEIGLLTGAPHPATAKAKTHVEVHQLPRDAIAPLLAENAGLAASFEKSVRRGLEFLHRGAAARATPDIGTKGMLLQRIKSMLRLGSG